MKIHFKVRKDIKSGPALKDGMLVDKRNGVVKF